MGGKKLKKIIKIGIIIIAVTMLIINIISAMVSKNSHSVIGWGAAFFLFIELLREAKIWDG